MRAPHRSPARARSVGASYSGTRSTLPGPLRFGLTIWFRFASKIFDHAFEATSGSDATQHSSDVGVDSSLAVFHQVRLGVGELDLVGGADAGEEGPVDGGRKELRGGFAREEDPALDGHPDLPAQALLGADRHVRV